MDFFFVLVEGIRGAGRKGGVVALVLGALFLAAGVSLAKEERGRSYGRRDHDVELAAGGILLGIGGIAGGLWLIVTGGSTPYEPTPTERAEPRPRSPGSGISTTGRRRTTPGRGRSGTPRPPS